MFPDAALDQEASGPLLQKLPAVKVAAVPFEEDEKVDASEEVKAVAVESQAERTADGKAEGAVEEALEETAEEASDPSAGVEPEAPSAQPEGEPAGAPAPSGFSWGLSF